MNHAAPLASPAETPLVPPPRARWDEGRLATKIVILLSLALVGGLLIGGFDARLGDRLWPGALAMFGAWLLLAAIGRRWIVAPYDTLRHWLNIQSHGPATTGLRQLPVHRRDEVGAVCRAIHAICTRAMREHHEAQRLRRTLDATIEAETARATGHLRLLAMRDDLTDLGNRRFLDEHLEPLIEAAVRTETDVVCVAIDLDYFKEVNDTLGHAEGDKLLVLLATLLRGCIRAGDLAIRLGGDEFVAILPGADLKRGIDLADRVRSLFLQQVRYLNVGEEHGPDISAGVASLGADGCRDGSELIHHADRHLYAAKHVGRGVTVAPALRADEPAWSL